MTTTYDPAIDLMPADNTVTMIGQFIGVRARAGSVSIQVYHDTPIAMDIAEAQELVRYLNDAILKAIETKALGVWNLPTK